MSRSGLGSNISQKVLSKGSIEPLTKIRALEWIAEKIGTTARYGKNVAIIGQPHAGKTNIALQHAFFNSKNIPQTKAKGYHDVVELMKSGILAEIEEIVVVESENNLKKALNDGVEKGLYRPLLPILDIIPVKIRPCPVQHIIRFNRFIWVQTEPALPALRLRGRQASSHKDARSQRISI